LYHGNIHAMKWRAQFNTLVREERGNVNHYYQSRPAEELEDRGGGDFFSLQTYVKKLSTRHWDFKS